MAKTTTKHTETKTRSILVADRMNHGTLGKGFKIGAKSHAMLNNVGFKVEYFVPTVEVLIGIGKDHTASLLMDEDAWKALKKGQKIHIGTLQEFKKKFL
jgi:hypothetical protein